MHLYQLHFPQAMNLTLYFENILCDIFKFLAKIIVNVLALSACRGTHELLYQRAGTSVSVYTQLQG